MTTTAIIMEPNQASRGLLRSMVEGVCSIYILAEIADCIELRAMLQKHRVDAVIADVGGLFCCGLETLSEFRASYPELSWITLSLGDRPEVRRTASTSEADATAPVIATPTSTMTSELATRP